MWHGTDGIGGPGHGRRAETEAGPSVRHATSGRVAYLADPVKLENGEPGYPPPALLERLRETGLPVEQIGVAQLNTLVERFTVLCVAGGFVLNYQSRMGATGAALVTEFVRRGGGYVGVCAGAYLGSSMALGLLPVDVLDATHWDRGAGPCQLGFTAQGRETLGAGVNAVTARYANGPIMRTAAASGDAADDGGGGGAAVTLARFVGEPFRPPVGSAHFMHGSPAIVGGTCGRGGGMVVLVSPHLEDGADEATRTPLRNAVVLCSAYCLHGRAACGASAPSATT